MMEWEQDMMAWTADVAKQGFDMLCTMSYGRIYLYFKTSTDTQWGELVWAQDQAPEGFTLAHDKGFAGNHTLDTLKYGVRNICMGLPLLPSCSPVPPLYCHGKRLTPAGECSVCDDLACDAQERNPSPFRIGA